MIITKGSMSYYGSDSKLIMKGYIEQLTKEANSNKIPWSSNKDGKIGKYTNIGHVRLNLMKYAIEIGDFTVRYGAINQIGIDGNLLIIKTDIIEAAFRLV